VKALEELIY